MRCLQAEGVLEVEVGAEAPTPCPDHPVSPLSQHRQLLKDSFMVELVEGPASCGTSSFTDLLLCTKLKKQSGGEWPCAPRPAGSRAPGRFLQEETGRSCQSACRGHLLWASSCLFPAGTQCQA